MSLQEDQGWVVCSVFRMDKDGDGALPPLPIVSDTANLVPVKAVGSAVDVMDVSDIMVSVDSVVKEVVGKGELTRATLTELPPPLPISPDADDLVPIKATGSIDVNDDMVMWVRNIFNLNDVTEFEASFATAKGDLDAPDCVSSIGFTDADICFGGGDVCLTGDEISLSQILKDDGISLSQVLNEAPMSLPVSSLASGRDHL